MKASLVTRLQESGVPHAAREVDYIIAHVLGTPFFRESLPEERALIESYVLRRAGREPLWYILGICPFHGVDIEATPAVLVPRQETEILVDRIVTELCGQDLAGKRLLDLCTGSGCIAVALKKALPDLEVVGADIAPEALAVARQNAVRNDVAVSFVEGDFLQAVAGQRFDFLVCNPPYVSESEYREVEPEVRFEPQGALVAGDGGLAFYKRLAADLPTVLRPGGRLWLEIGSLQGGDIKKIFGKGALIKDWSQQNRFFVLEFE